jgi:hypothetical protein
MTREWVCPYNCCWSRQRNHSWVRVPRLLATFYCLRLKTRRLGGPGPRIYIPPKLCGPVIPPGPGFPLHRLLRLARLRWNYSNPPSHGLTHNSKFTLYTCIVSARTAQNTPLPTVSLLLLASLLLWERGTKSIENTGSPVVTLLFPRSGRFFWHHNSCFEQICHIILKYETANSSPVLRSSSNDFIMSHDAKL